MPKSRKQAKEPAIFPRYTVFHLFEKNTLGKANRLRRILRSLKPLSDPKFPEEFVPGRNYTTIHTAKIKSIKAIRKICEDEMGPDDILIVLPRNTITEAVYIRPQRYADKWSKQLSGFSHFDGERVLGLLKSDLESHDL